MIVEAPPETPAALHALGCRLRALREDDLSWQRALFAQSRPELSMLRAAGPAHESLVAQQFGFQQAHYRAHHAAADFLAIECERGEPVGRVIVDRDYAPREVRLVDVLLQAPWRGRGIGSALLRWIQQEAGTRGCVVTLHVAHHNVAARRLYERLGFVHAGDAGAHVFMRWSPTS